MESRPTDETITFDTGMNDFLSGGVTERRIKEEMAAYDEHLRRLADEMAARNNAANLTLVIRIRAIISDPFVQLPPPGVDGPSDGGTLT